MENSTTSCAADDRFALSSPPGHNLQNPNLGVSPIIIITCHITKMIKTLPNIQWCDHLQSHLFQPSLHWPPCKQGRSWQVWKWRYDVLIIVTMIKGCPHHQNNFLFGPGISCASPISTYDAKILKIYHSQLIALDSFSCHGHHGNDNDHQHQN